MVQCQQQWPRKESKASAHALVGPALSFPEVHSQLRRPNIFPAMKQGNADRLAVRGPENTLAAVCRAPRAAWQYEMNFLSFGSEALLAQQPEHPYFTVWSRVWRLRAATHRLGGGPQRRAGQSMHASHTCGRHPLG